MEPVFVNTCTLNKKNLAAIGKAYAPRRARHRQYLLGSSADHRPVRVFCNLRFFNGLFLAVSWVRSSLSIFSSCRASPRGMTVKRYQVLYHAEIVSELQFFDDHILMQSEQSKEHIELQYEQIKRSFEQKTSTCCSSARISFSWRIKRASKAARPAALSKRSCAKKAIRAGSCFPAKRASKNDAPALARSTAYRAVSQA